MGHVGGNNSAAVFSHDHDRNVGAPRRQVMLGDLEGTRDQAIERGEPFRQPWRVRRVFGRVEVRLGDATTLCFEIPEAPARFGLVSERTTAAFSGFALTRHLDLWGSDLASAGHVFTARPRCIADEAGLAAAPGRTLVLEAVGDISSSTVHEFALPAAGSRVVLWPRGDAVRIVIEPDAYFLAGPVGDESRYPLDPPFADASSVAVRCIRHGDEASVQVGRRIHTLALADPQPANRRIELTGARLARYEWTAHPTPHHPTQSAKEYT